MGRLPHSSTGTARRRIFRPLSQTFRTLSCVSLARKIHRLCRLCSFLPQPELSTSFAVQRRWRVWSCMPGLICRDGWAISPRVSRAPQNTDPANQPSWNPRQALQRSSTHSPDSSTPTQLPSWARPSKLERRHGTTSASRVFSSSMTALFFAFFRRAE